LKQKLMPHSILRLFQQKWDICQIGHEGETECAYPLRLLRWWLASLWSDALKVRKDHKGHNDQRGQPVRPDRKEKKAIWDRSEWLVHLVRLVRRVQAAASARLDRLVHPAHRVLSGPVACTH
jgi:hypothetical protein